MHVSAIVVAAGLGLRLKQKVSKALIKIKSRPVIIYSLIALNKHPGIKDIIVVANRNNFKGITSAIIKYRISKIKDVVLGGAKRQDSVLSGLRAVSPNTDLVLIHDAARPFVDRNSVSAVIKEARKTQAAIVGVPVKATIKEAAASGVVKRTIDRRNLWEIQTPQVFNKDLILAAYKKFGKSEVTDDAMLVEKMGVKVSLVRGTYANVKITTPEDLMIAGALVKKCKIG